MPIQRGMALSFSATKSTRYPISMRSASNTKPESLLTVKLMHISGELTVGKRVPPMLLPLWDAIGIAHELNGYRNEVAGRVDQYSKERDVQIDAINLLTNLEQDLPQRASDAVMKRQRDQATAGSKGWSKQVSDERRAAASKMPEPQRSQQLEIIALRDQDAKQGIPTYISQQREEANRFTGAQRTAMMAKMDAAILNFDTIRDANAYKNIEHARVVAKEDWEKHAKYIDWAALTTFKKHFTELSWEAENLLEVRTVELIKWLEAPLFVDTLEDFHSNHTLDALAFEDHVSNATFGMESSKAGAKKIDEWVKEGKASTKSNLVWRTIALNQTAAIKDVDAAIAEAQKHHAHNKLAHEIDLASFANKLLKGFTDTYKKTQGIADANVGALAGTKSFNVKIKPVNLRGLDVAMIGFGDRIFRAFRINNLADGAAEHLIHHMLALNNGAARADILKSMRTIHKALDAAPKAMRTIQADAVMQAWEEFTTKSTKAPTAIKTVRLTTVVMLFEALNFFKLGKDCIEKGDGKSFALLAASAMSIMSALLDIASTPVKEVQGATSWSYQKIKLYGGVLSGAATLIGAIFDAKDYKKQSAAGESGLAFLYALKFALGATSGGLTLFTGVTYSGPLIQRLTNRTAIGLAEATTGKLAQKLIVRRIFMFLGSGWITVSVTVIQVVLYFVTPDELEKWCKHCAFGRLRASETNAGSVTSQRKALALALEAVS